MNQTLCILQGPSPAQAHTQPTNPNLIRPTAHPQTRQAPAAATDLRQSASFASPSVLRAPRAHGGGLWRKLNNTFGAAWELNGVPPPPLHLRATNGQGQTIVVANAIPKAGVLGVRFFNLLES